MTSYKVTGSLICLFFITRLNRDEFNLIGVRPTRATAFADFKIVLNIDPRVEREFLPQFTQRNLSKIRL